MANKPKKTVAKAASKATQAKAGAGPAVAARSKDAKPSFGKAAPKKVTTTAAKATAPKAAAKTRAAPKVDSGGSIAEKVARTVKATANVAVGAVVATAKTVSSAVGKGSKSKSSKTKAS